MENIREAQRKDFDLFNYFYVRFSSDDEKIRLNPMEEERYEYLLERGNIFFFEVDGEAIGYALVNAYDDAKAEIIHFYITDKNKGYGTRFYHMVEKEIRSAGINKITIHVFWEEAERFWKRKGFKSVRGTEEYQKVLD